MRPLREVANYLRSQRPGFALALVSRYNKTRASHKANRNLSFLPTKGGFKTVNSSRTRRGRPDFTREKQSTEGPGDGKPTLP